MKKPSLIDHPLRQSIYLHCMQEIQRERRGLIQDLEFMAQDQWLKDTAVSEYLMKRKGMWEIHLVFAWHTAPFQLIKRCITAVPSSRRAELTASYMRRQAAKDARGTLYVDATHFSITDN